MNEKYLYNIAQQALATPAKQAAPNNTAQSGTANVSMAIPHNWALWLQQLKDFLGQKANNCVIFLAGQVMLRQVKFHPDWDPYAITWKRTVNWEAALAQCSRPETEAPCAHCCSYAS